MRWLARVPGVLPLEDVEGDLLQVLVNEFTLRREASGVHLQVEFGMRAPAIRGWGARSRLRRDIPRFKTRSEQLQTRIEDTVFGSQRTTLEHSATQNFPFRYASGGTLPIVQFEGEDRSYYCLFYREIPPIGWNIANGSCNNFDELLDPVATIERELREELIVLDLTKSEPKDYRLEWSEPCDLHSLDLARRLLQPTYGIDVAKFKRARLPVHSEVATDVLTVTIGRDTRIVRDCFVNVNAADYGIEIDRIGLVTVPRKAVFVDGEMLRNQLIGSPVGLFEVGSVQEQLRAGSRRFVADRLYFRGIEREATALRKVLSEFVGDVRRRNLVTENSLRPWRTAVKRANELELCPVTKQIVRRHGALLEEGRTTRQQPLRLFISYTVKDEQLASRLYRAFLERGVDCFKWQDARVGMPLWGEITKEIRTRDRVLLIASQASLQRRSVTREIERALQVEAERGKPVLLSIDIDGFVHDWDHYLQPDLKMSNIANGRDWRTERGFATLLERLFRDLEVE